MAKEHIMLQDAVDIFRDAGAKLIMKGKSIQPSSLAEPWRELENIV